MKALGALLLGACGAPAAPAPSVIDSLYSATNTTLQIEIAYEPGAEPYGGNIPSIGDTWKVSQSNLNGIFAGKKKVVLPATADSWEALSDVVKGSYSEADILQIAGANQKLHSNGTTALVYLLFLPGYYDNGMGAQDQVLGVTFGQTGVVALFKPAIVAGANGATSPSDQYIARFIEQFTITHEMGHALGVVNNGIPMVVDHQDTAHGDHCQNPDCVMYWLNTGAASAIQFIQKRIQTGSEVLYGAECLADVAARLSSK